MHPAVRLFRLGSTNIEPYGPKHLSLDVASVCALAERFSAAIVASEFTRNPWSPDRAPLLHLQSA
jgi:hypothetical protein